MAIIEKMMFIDTSKCIACKACQVACKQWHSLPAETTSFTGSYQNPPDFSSGKTLTYVKFTEHVDYYGKLRWLFFKNQCRHCLRPKCSQRNPKGVKRLKNGIVLFNDGCTWQNVRLTLKEKKYYDWKNLDDPAKKPIAIELFVNSCPFLVPGYSEELQRFVKCDFCFDRINGGKTTACELTCPVGAIKTGDPKVLAKEATARYREVRSEYPDACLHNGGFGKTSVVFLLTERPGNYDYAPARGL